MVDSTLPPTAPLAGARGRGEGRATTAEARRAPAGGSTRTAGSTGPESESIEGPFLRVARRYSLCDDDAWEALATGFEIAMRHRERIRRETAAAWLATVVIRTFAPSRFQPRVARS